ncbi:hypothetical protein AMC87_CH03181 [Rhizobium phaseoli]|nr:hypothetical protein AMC87_CH03181 [Rhizobium phaseoli]
MSNDYRQRSCEPMAKSTISIRARLSLRFGSAQRRLKEANLLIRPRRTEAIAA